MIDIKFLRENPDVVKENIKKKFQDKKLPLVDEVIELDEERRASMAKADELRANRNKLSKEIGALMAQGKKDEAMAIREKVTAQAQELEELGAKEKELNEKVTSIMMSIPNIIDDSVPIGKDDSENVEVERFGEPVVPDYEIPYHTDIMESFDGIDLEAAGRVAGNGFYYLMGDIARLHSAVISYARDFMIDRGFTYVVPPFMIRSNVVTGVMSFEEMDAMMYKIEGEDLYLIGTSEHSMIGKFIDTITPEEKLPLTLTSYSPCFRKEKGAHGIEERGVYRIHQFEKQEMVVVCKPEESKMWFDKLWQNTVDLFRSLDIPVRTLECCSGDLADLKVKSVDVEAWSPRQKKYFEVGSCSNLTDAQENIKKKFQDKKLPLVDEVIELDEERRASMAKADELRANRNKLSKEIGALMAQGKKDEAMAIREKVTAQAQELEELGAKEKELNEKVTSIMMSIPNIIDDSVPIGKDDSENVEVERFGEPVVPDYEIPYHTDIMESFDGIDLEAAGRVAGNGFYYLMGDIARLHSAVISYARDFMIDRGFTYVVPPFMIRSNVVTGVMSFEEMDAMMYKIEGEDLYLIGTSEHSMIGKFIDTITPEEKLPLTLTSYSPCFRKEKGAHGIEERGVYRIHQFEKQEMVVVCKPEESKMWFDKLWQNTVDLFRSLDIPVRTLECCSGDLADLKVKSVDVEAWSPRQKKYFEVGSCSNLTDAQARRLKIRIKGENGNYLAHTLNNTVVAPPRMLIAFLENNLQADGSVLIPEALRMYMGGKDRIVPKK